MNLAVIPERDRLLRVAMLFMLLGAFLKAVAIPVANVNYDTNFYLNIGSNFLERGELTPYMWRLGADTNIIAGSGTGYGIYLLNYWFKFFGLTLLSGYVLMFILGLLCLGVLYFLARDWWGGPVAGIGAITYLSLSGTFISIFYIRMDAPAILTYLLVLWLHVRAVQSERRWLHGAVGVVIIAAAEVHLQILLYIAAISLYYALDYLRALRQQRRIVWDTPALYYFGGALVAGVIYLLVHVVPDPEAYTIISRECPLCTPPGPLQELRRLSVFLSERPVDILFLVLALGAARLRHTHADQHFITLVIGYLIGQAVLNPPLGVQYLSHLLPLLGLGVGGLFMQGTDPDGHLTAPRLTLGIYVLSFMFLFQFVLYLDYFIEMKPTPESIDYARDYVPTDAVVMGSPELFHYIIDYDQYLSYNSGERYGILLRDESYLDFWARIGPQVFLGEPQADDAEWWRYMYLHDFQQVRDEVWVDGAYLAALSAGSPAPDVTFTTSAAALDFGECATLAWAVVGADRVKLDDDAAEPVGTFEVCPYTATDYTLAAYWVGGIEEATVTITVK